MAEHKPPPRPSDPVGAWMWDMSYGPASQATPFAVVGQKIDGLKEDLKVLVNVAKSIDETNKTLRESNQVMRDMNSTLKSLIDKLK